MQPQQLMEHLTRLDSFEVVGKQYHEMFGRDLEFQKYLLLSLQTWETMPPIEALVSPVFEKKSAQIRRQFSNCYSTSRLSEDNFIDPQRDIEVEKLLRYIEIPAHKHGFIEVVHVLSGQCRHTVDGQVYMQGPGCLTFLNPHVTHELRAEPNCLCLTTKIRGDTFLDFHIPNMPYFAVPVCWTPCCIFINNRKQAGAIIAKSSRTSIRRFLLTVCRIIEIPWTFYILQLPLMAACWKLQTICLRTTKPSPYVDWRSTWDTANPTCAACSKATLDRIFLLLYVPSS